MALEGQARPEDLYEEAAELANRIAGGRWLCCAAPRARVARHRPVKIDQLNTPV